jgi:hypothetical protein
MRCRHCQSPMMSDDAVCPDCGHPLGGPKGSVGGRPKSSRGLALVACLLATPAWFVAIPFLTMTAQAGGAWWHGLVAFAVLAAAIAAMVVAVRLIDALDLVKVLAFLGLWGWALAVATPMFGLFGFLLLYPIGLMAALAAILGLLALALNWRAGWPARVLALLSCAGLPLLIGSVCLLGNAHAAREARQMAQTKRMMPGKALPHEQRRYDIRTEGKHSLSFPRNAYCVVAPADGPVPTPEEAGDLVGPIAAEDIRVDTFLLACLSFNQRYANYERVARIELPTIGRKDGYLLISESWPNQPLGVYPGESYLTPRSGRADAQPIRVGDVKVGMYLQLCEGRQPATGVLLVGPVTIHYEKVISVALGP